MLTSEGCAQRRARLWEQIPERIEWLLIADPRHVHYLTGFWVPPLSFSGGERALLLLEREQRATLLADNFTAKSGVGPHFVDRDVIETWYDHKHAVMNRDLALLGAVKTVRDRVYGRPGVVEAEWLPLAASELLAADHESHALRRDGESEGEEIAVDLGTLLRKLRRNKHQDELELMRQCMRATTAGHARAVEVIQAGMTEFDVYREVHAAALKSVGRPAFIYGDFRAALPDNPKVGGAPTNYILKNGDMFILDYSVVIDGYRSDFTNTICVGGKPTAQQKELFDCCWTGLQAGQAVLKAGIGADKVHAAVKTPMNAFPCGETFNHHAGHGIGLAHPEAPILVPESTDVLEVGDVVTLEPGVYVKGVGGIRIENNYLITATGCEKLSDHTIAL
ncbi:MAG: Xaa-Pro peptidase family protein [Planctomycetales bacterium]